MAGRHEALRDFFVRVLSVEASEAESAACKMEHTLSPDLRRRLTAFARFMEQCPRGKPEWTEKEGYLCEARARCPSRTRRKKARAK